MARSRYGDTHRRKGETKVNTNLTKQRGIGMNTYMLIHGSCHGAWCWNKVISPLQQAGHSVIALDLPGHGSDKTPVSHISLHSYTDCIVQVLDAQSESVILLGHSMGGTAITQAAECRPDKIKMLVYLCAFVPQNGESQRELAQRDPDSLVGQNLTVVADQGYCIIREEAIKAALYHDCSIEDITRAQSLLCPEPIAPLVTPVNTTMDNFGRIPKVYIQCLRDRAISPPFQEKMYTSTPFLRVIQMNTSHSPFFSAPEELVAHLISIC